MTEKIRKTHYFENVVHVKEDRLELSEDLIIKKNQGFHAALLKGQTLENENATEKMCSSDGNVVWEMCAPADTDTYRDSCSFVPTETKAG